MANVAVVTDTISCLPRDLIEQHDIHILPIIILADGRVFKDWVDITPQESYEIFLKNPDEFRTSAPSTDDCILAMLAAREKSANIVCITVSREMSAVYSAALLAKEHIMAVMPDTQIEVIDSETATASEGFVALAAARAASGGAGLAEVTQAAENMKTRAQCLFVLDTIRHIYRSGRIPRVASQVGSVLNIRPILEAKRKVEFLGAVRSRHAGIERILKLTHERAGNRRLHISVMHAYALAEAEQLMETVEREFDCAELWLSEFSPVMGYACGTGTLGLAFYAED